MTEARSIADPIAPELLRTQLEAIGQEAGAAVEQTAISPIVTESKDYSVTILDALGNVLSGSSTMEIQFGVAMHSVRTTISVHGDSIAEGDLFLANDPHSGGGVHPQDVVIQQPVFVDGRRVAWVALTAHMMDMGGMVPGSSAVNATECFQEALRLPPVRLIRQGKEVADIWNILRINIRSADLVEMDVRSLVIGADVASKKIARMVADLGIAEFEATSQALVASGLAVLRRRIGEIEDGHYRAVARVEYRDSLLKIPCDLEVSGEHLRFDFTQAPPQVPHFFNSKAYILRAAIVPRLREILAPGLPINQALYDVVEIATKPGTLVDSVSPAPIAAAHMDAAMAVDAAAWQCLLLAIHASPHAKGREWLTAPAPAAYGVGRWYYPDFDGQRRVYTVLEGSMCGSPAGHDRDGIDLKSSLTKSGSRMELADVEVLEAVYPVLFSERGVRLGGHGYGQHRSGAGCYQAFALHGVDVLTGNLTGTKAWFPQSGAAGGLPGATMQYLRRRADGSSEALHIQAVGVELMPGEHFELNCASGGGFGDPLDRNIAALVDDLAEQRLDPAIAAEVYGAVCSADGTIDPSATAHRRESLRRERLARSRPARHPYSGDAILFNDTNGITSPKYPLYPGVVQLGERAIAAASGAVLALAPGNWLDGCPTLDTPLDTPLDGRAGDLVVRAHLDPLTGRMLFVDIVFVDEEPGIEIRPERWTRAATAAGAPEVERSMSHG